MAAPFILIDDAAPTHIADAMRAIPTTAVAAVLSLSLRSQLAYLSLPITLKLKTMKILHILGGLLIVAWLVLWLALKLTFVAIHALAVLGLILIIAAFFAGRSTGSGS